MELFAKDSALRRGLDAARQRLQSFGKTVSLAGAGLAAAGTALLLPLLSTVDEFAALGDQMNKMSLRLNTSVESLTQLKFAAEQSGSGIEELELGMRRMQQVLASAAGGNSVAAASFSKMGLSVKDLLTLSPDQQLEAIADGVDAIANPAQKAATAIAIFGRSGAKLLPLMVGGAANIKALREEANRLGIDFTTQDAQAAADITDAFNRWDKSVKAVKNQIAAALVPALLEGYQLIQPFLTAIVQWARENRALVVTVAAVGAGLIVAGSALAGIGVAAIVAAAAIGAAGTLITAAIVAVKVAFVALLAVVALALNPLTIISALFLTQTESGRRLAGIIGGELSDAWGTLKETAVDAWGGITSALKRGDLQAAGQIAMAGLLVVWRQGILSLQSAWGGLKDSLVEVFSSALAIVQNIWTNTTSYLQRKFTDLLGGLIERAAKLADFVGADTLATSLKDFAAGAAAAGKEIEEERRRTLKERKAQLEKEKAEREQGREAVLAGPRAALEAAREAFRQLLADEAEKAKKDAAPAKTPQAKADDPVERVTRAVKGAFQAGNFAAVLGRADTLAQKQFDESKKQTDLLKGIKDAVQIKPAFG